MELQYWRLLEAYSGPSVDKYDYKVIMEADFSPSLNTSVKIDRRRFYGNRLDKNVDKQPELLTSRYRRRELRLGSILNPLPASDLER